MTSKNGCPDCRKLWMAYATATIVSRKVGGLVQNAAYRHDLEAALEFANSRAESEKVVDQARHAMQVHQRRHRVEY